MVALRARLIPIATLLAVAIGWFVTGRLEIWTIDGPGPGLLPRIALAITGLTAFLILFGKGEVEREDEPAEAAEPPRTFLVYALACGTMAVAVPWFGFVPPGLVSVFAILKFAENRSWPISIGYAAALVFGLVLFFGTGLGVQFPEGPVERVLQSMRLL